MTRYKRMKNPVETSEQFLESIRAKLHLRNPRIVNLISEFYATALLLFIGIAIVMQYILSHEKLNTWIQINIGWGFALTLCVLLSSKTSGGHMNPAVSFLMYTRKVLSFTDFILYSIVQTMGAFVGSALAYFVYYDQVQHYAGNLRTVSGANSTAILFCSFPPEHLTNRGAFIDQIAGTAILTTFVTAVIDKRNRVPEYLHAILFGVTLQDHFRAKIPKTLRVLPLLITIGTSYGMNLGYPINPARDLGPRIFASLIYGTEVFTFHDYYFWIPVIAPFLGAFIGSWIYTFLVSFQIQEEKRVVVLEKNGDLEPFE